MNKQQWQNLKVLIDERYSFCISRADFYNIASAPFNKLYLLGFEVCTEPALLKIGIYGWFKSGLVSVCVSKDIKEGYIKISNEKSNQNIIENIVHGKPLWSSAVPLDYLTSVEQLERLLKLKAFW